MDRGTWVSGFGKAREVPEAIRKSVEHAKKDLLLVPLKDTTIPCEITGHFGAARVYLKAGRAGDRGHRGRRGASGAGGAGCRTSSPRPSAPTTRTTC